MTPGSTPPGLPQRGHRPDPSNDHNDHNSQRNPWLSMRRLLALARKESYQIVRDPSSILVAFVLPVLLLFILGYAVNLDASRIRLGVLNQDGGQHGTQLVAALSQSSVFELHRVASLRDIEQQIKRGSLRGAVVIDPDFSRQWQLGQGSSAVQVITDGAEPNTASFIAAYVQGTWQGWQQSVLYDLARADSQARNGSAPPVFEIRQRTWFNPAAISRNFLVPGSISVVMTIIGVLLTSLVVAREWERGTMEALLATPITRTELLLAKIIPYYVLGMCAMLLCLLVAVWVMQVPFRGSLAVLFVIASLFLASALGLGLFLSTVMRNQFHAAQAALTAGFLPAMMLSGFVYEISSMPLALQWFTRLIPARYFTNSLQTLFQVGNVGPLLLANAAGLALLSLFWLGLSARKTRRTLD